MRRTSLLAVAVILAALPVNLAWGQANLPNNPNAATVQGPDPTGMLGYPLATVPATGALPWPVSGTVTANQGTSPWICGTQAWTGANWTNALTVAAAGGTDGSSLLGVGLLLYNEASNIFQRARTIQPATFALATDQAHLLTRSLLSAYNVTGDGRLYPVTMLSSEQNSGSNASIAALDTTSYPHEYDGSAWPGKRTPSAFKTVATAAAGNTALWTPAAGKKFRLMRYMVTVTDQATQAGAGTLTFTLFDGAAGVTGQVHDVFVPALGLVNTGSLYSSGWIDLGNGYLSTAANNVLNINLSAALTAGTVRVICCGTEE